MKAKKSNNHNRNTSRGKHRKRILNTNPVACIFISVVLISFLLVLAGCNSLGSKKKENKEQLPDEFRTGSEGVYMEFMPNAPAARVYMEDPEALNVQLKVQNKGAFDLAKGNDFRIELQGFDTNLIQMVKDDTILGTVVPGKSQAYPTGGIGFVSWTAAISEFPGELYSPVLQATACYRYVTTATPLVCIDPKPYTALAQDKVCTVRDVSLAGGQGAPVAVTKVEESIIRPKSGTPKALFRIYVANVGGGTVISPTSAAYTAPFTKCMNKQLSVTDIDKIRVIPKLGQGVLLRCVPNEVMLINGVGVATCEADFVAGADQSAYLTQLEIRLEYGYTKSISQPVKIVRTGTALDAIQNR